MVHLSQAVYFAPRGRGRMLELGDHILRHYIHFEDKLIGFIGGAGAGKSVLIEGMLKEFTLTNDDQGVNIRPLPLIEAYYNGFFTENVYHVDIRFELAFYSLNELTKAILTALSHERRVIVEHFDRIYPDLQINAQVLVGVGEEVIVTRPQLFGPDPRKISRHVEQSLVYRKMAHTAEELVGLALEKGGWPQPDFYSEVHHGFVMGFYSDPKINLQLIKKTVNQLIEDDLPISAEPEKSELHIGEAHTISCTGPRVHLNSTSELTDLIIWPELMKDPISQRYLLIGYVSEQTGPLLSFELPSVE